MPVPRLTPKLHGRMVSGRIQWHGVDGKRLAVITRHLEGQEVELTLQKTPRKSTRKQREYYWPVIVGMIAEETGHSPETVHEALKIRFLSVPSDGPLQIVRSTEDLTTTEREEYHRKCRQFGDEFLGIYIPEPNEVI